MTTPAPLRPTSSTVARADLALRCASLRGHAREVGVIDPSGWLAAQLLDLAHLLEVADREGWWGR